MSQFTEGPTRTFQASAALAKYRRVRLSSGKLAYAGAANTDALGALVQATHAADEDVAVRLLNAQGTHPCVASEAISAGATVYAAANGKVAASGTVIVGVALDAATADNDIIEVLPAPAPVLGAIARTALVEDALQPYAIPVDRFRVWDAPATVIPATPANDDLGLIYNTFLTLPPTIETGDLKNAGATTRKTAFQVEIPPEYVAGQALTLRINAGMKTTVASVSATVDAQVARVADPTVDVCATAAQDINNLAAANKDFTITPTNVVPGDLLDVVISVAVNDSGTGTAVIGKINKVELLADIKG